MILACLFVLGSTVLAQDSPPPVALSVVSVQGTTESGGREKEYGSGLEEVRNALEDLSFDRYSLVNDSRVQAPFGRATSVDLGFGYSLSVKPLEREANGQVRMNVDVVKASQKAEGQKVNAVSTTVTIAPGGQFKLRGLKLERGEMIVVVSMNR